MAEHSTIEWTHHTFNPVLGCQKVGPGCDHCYAEGWAKRSGLVTWGPGETRRVTSDAYWRQPLKWDREAKAAGERRRVFCASLADVFDNAWPDGVRHRLWALIKATPNLDWMLLTKRPGNIAKMLPDDWGTGYQNVWLGCTIVNQEEADRDIPKLLSVPAAVHFLSMEPLLGPVDIGSYLPGSYECEFTCGWRGRASPTVEVCNECGVKSDSHGEFCVCGAQDFSGVCPDCGNDAVYDHPNTPCLDLVIVGGESGPGARPMHPDWARSLRDQCVAAGTAFFFKQWGEWAPAMHDPEYGGHVLRQTEPVGPFDSWKANAYDPDRLEGVNWRRIGKKAAGRMLDGRTWDEMPQGDLQ